MLDSTIREWFRNETASILTNDFFNEAFDVFQKFLEINVSYYDFEGAITQMYNTHFTRWEDSIQRFTNIEIYMKALYNTLVEDVYIISEEEDDDTKLELLYKTVFQVVPATTPLTSVNPNTLTARRQKYYAIIYQFRNKITHKSLSKNIDLTPENLAREMQAMIVCYLDLAHQKRNDISLAYASRKAAEFLNRSQYANKQIDEWKKYTRDFKYINLRWCDSTHNGFRMEQLADGNDTYIKLSGDAGTGKTTALKYLAQLLANRIINSTSKVLPVYLSLSRISRESEELLVSDAASQLGVTNTQLKQLFELGEVILLLDGLNEILDVQLKSDIEMKIDEIISGYPKCHIIVTDRNRPLQADKARKMFLMDLTLEDKMTYFQRNCTDSEILKMIKEKAQVSPNFFLNLTKPLLLQQFLEVTMRKREIPMDMTGDYINMLMEREAVEKKEPNTRYLEYYLEDIAWVLANSQEKKQREAKILSIMAEVNRNKSFTAPDTLYCLNLAIGMGILQREDDNYISFVNVSYLNYYMNNYMENNND